jgi:hypothetical protein
MVVNSESFILKEVLWFLLTEVLFASMSLTRCDLKTGDASGNEFQCDPCCCCIMERFYSLEVTAI